MNVKEWRRYQDYEITMVLKNADDWTRYEEGGNGILFQDTSLKGFKPPLEVEIHGLNRRKMYCIGVHCALECLRPFRYVGGSEKWMERTDCEPKKDEPTNEVFTENLSGKQIMEHLDLSNIQTCPAALKSQIEDSDNMIELEDRYKYIPIIRIYEVDGAEKRLIHQTLFPETKFIVIR